jgi:hypothetical protein
MPRFDGTGPQGMGPMTGRGEGYCALAIPDSGQAPYGYAGVQGTPVRLEAPATRPALGARFIRWPRMVGPLSRGRGRGARRGRGRWFARR